MMPTRLVLIRHGITDWNKKKRYCGSRDVGLSKEGKAQAGQLRRALEPLSFDRIYSSNKKRAVQTAGIVFKGCKITKIRGLRELSFGALEGLRHAEIMQKYPGVYEKWLADPFKNNIPRGERLNVFKKRVNYSVKKIARLNQGKTVAVVCHGGTISMFITGLRKRKNFWRYIPGSASFTIVEYKNNRPKIKVFNQTDHLR
jgi:broad specificity phosphatase PhoE